MKNKYIFLLFCFLAQNISAQSFNGYTDIGLPDNFENFAVSTADFDNDGDLDIAVGNRIFTNNGENDFSEIEDLQDFSSGTVSWGDYNNDGFADLLLTGWSGNGRITKLYNNNGNKTFSEIQNTPFDGVSASSTAWGDYDNDNYLDILISGYSTIHGGAVSLLYHNNKNGSFSLNTSASLPGVENSAISWSDYDNDGFRDILLTGKSKGTYISQLYHNNKNNSFSLNSNAVFPGVVDGSAAWGDYNNDGYSDLLLTGYSSNGYVAKLFRNKGDNSFAEETGITMPGVAYSSAAWGDYDADGYLDIIIAGNTGSESVSKIYRNNGNKTFTDQTDIPLPTIEGGSVLWGDYDNDGDLDILLAGGSDDNYSYIVGILLNNIISGSTNYSNSAPSAPVNMSAEAISTDLKINWSKASDIETPQNGLSYNLYIYEQGLDNYFVSPQALLSSGNSLIAKIGSLQWSESGYTLKGILQKGKKYNYSLQTIDAGLKGSEFAIEKSYVDPMTSDSLALIDFFNNTNGTEWTRKDNWLTGPINTWYGVTLENERISSLDLNSNNLSGQIPDDISKLSELKSLDLSFNQLSGEIPIEISYLIKLNRINLNNNLLEGAINLPQTDTPFANIGSNYFTFEPILKNINKLTVYSPQKTIGEPSVIVKDKGSKCSINLNFDDTITGNIYLWRKNGADYKTTTANKLLLPFLEEFDAGEYTCLISNSKAPNLQLSTAPITVQVNVPVYSRYTDSLALVALYNSANGPNWRDRTNWLTGPLNTWDNVGLTNGRVTSLSFWQDNMQGSLPEEIGNLSKLNSFYTWACNIGGEFPMSFYNLEDLEYLTLWGNSFIGELSDNIGNLKKLKYISLSRSGLKGKIPESIGELTKLERLDLYEMGLVGSIPSSIGNLTEIQYLNLNGNKLSGNLPSSIGRLNKLRQIYICSNQLTGSLPIELWSLTQLIELKLSNNQLSGSLPESIGDLTQLQKIDLSNNNISGSLPESIGDLTQLQEIDLSNNNISGVVPESLFQMSNLVYLRLPNNQLTGFSSINTTSKLSLIDLSYNKLKGNLPKKIFELPNMSYLNLCNNELTGELPAIDGSTSKLLRLDLQDNYFLGPIPTSFGNLIKMRELRLSNNKLTGTFPLAILKLTELNSLSIQNNQLDSIPIFNREIYGFNCQNNLLTFSSIINNRVKNFNPQDTIGRPEIVRLRVGSNYSINLSFDNSVIGNIYNWQKNGIAYSTTLTNKLLFTNISESESGHFTCKVTNPNVSDLILITAPITIIVENLINDSLALADLFNSANGNNWTNKTNWLSGPVNTWYGVTVTNKRVTALNLANNGLKGTLPNSLADLTGIKTLNFSNNSLFGAVPASITSLHGTEIDLSGNNFLPGNIIDAYNARVADCSFTYSPQIYTGADETQSVDYENDIQLSFTAGLGTMGNEYIWYHGTDSIASSTNGLLTLTNVQPVDSGVYACLLKNSALPLYSMQSNTFRIHVNVPAPIIDFQPVSQTICKGTNTQFVVKAHGYNTQYKWQANVAGDWIDLTDNEYLTGSTNDTLLISNAPIELSQTTIHCMVSNSFNEPVSSTNASLTVLVPPTVIAQPQNLNVCFGSNGSFEVQASGNYYENLSYNWYKQPDNTLILSTSNKLTISNVSNENNGSKYYCIISNTCGSITTDTVLLAVLPIPGITQQPIADTTCEGSYADFTVIANSAVSYQWYFNEQPLIGAINDTYSISSASAYNEGLYTVKLENAEGCSIVSEPAELVVQRVIQPSIITNYAPSIVCLGSEISFSATALNAGNWPDYKWYINDTLAGNNISLQYVPGLNDRVKCTVTSSEACTAGKVVESTVHSQFVNVPPQFVGTVAQVVQCMGLPAVINPSVITNSLNNYYVWQRSLAATPLNFEIIANATNSVYETLPVSAEINNSNYICSATNFCGSATSNVINLKATASPVVVLQPKSDSICENLNNTFRTTVTSVQKIEWQYITTTGLIVNTGIFTNSYTVRATVSNNGYGYRCKITGLCGTLFYTNTAYLNVKLLPRIQKQPVSVTLCPGSAAKFEVVANGYNIRYQWQKKVKTDYVNIVGANKSTYTIENVNVGMNDDYFQCIVTSGCGNFVGSSRVRLAVNIPVSFTSQPLSKTICEGTVARYTVTAQGTLPHFDWYFSTGLPGESFKKLNRPYSNYSVTASAANNGYKYYCLIYGSCGDTLRSDTVSLKVDLKPRITLQPISKNVCLNDSVGFKVEAREGSIRYQWKKGLKPAELNEIPGETSNILSFKNAQYAQNGMYYRCIVTNDCGTLPSSLVRLIVYTPPVITTEPADVTVCEGGNTAIRLKASGTSLRYYWSYSIDKGSTFRAIGYRPDSLILTNVRYTSNFYLYRSVVSGICGKPDTSQLAQLTVKKYPVITLHPKSVSVCQDEDTSFTVTATGENLTYQWQILKSGSWSNIIENINCSGAKTAKLVLKDIFGYYDSTAVQCIVSNGNCSIKSNPANISVNLYIQDQPSSTSTCDRLDTAIHFTAINKLPNTWYQWQVFNIDEWVDITNSDSISNVNSSKLIFTSPSLSLSGKLFRCKVWNTICSIYTSEVKLTVNPYPSKPIVTQSGNTLSTPSQVTHEWYINNSVIPNNNNNTINWVNTGHYSVRTIENSCKSAASESLFLTDYAGGKVYSVNVAIDSVYFNAAHSLEANQRFNFIFGVFYGSKDCNSSYTEIVSNKEVEAKKWHELSTTNNSVSLTSSSVFITTSYKLDRLPDSSIINSSRSINFDLRKYQPNRVIGMSALINNEDGNDSVHYTVNFKLSGYPAYPFVKLTGDNEGVLCENMETELNIPGLPVFNYNLKWEYAWDIDSTGDWSKILPENIHEIATTTNEKASVEWTIPKPPSDATYVLIRAKHVYGTPILIESGKRYKVLASKGFYAEVESPLKRELHPYNVTCFGGFDGKLIFKVKGGVPNYKYTLKATISEPEYPSRIHNINEVGSNFKDSSGLGMQVVISDSLFVGTYNWRIEDSRKCLFKNKISLTQPDSLKYSTVITHNTRCSYDSAGKIEVKMKSEGNYVFELDTLYSNTTGIFEKLPLYAYDINVTKYFILTKSDTVACNILLKPQLVRAPEPIEFTSDDMLVGYSPNRCYNTPLPITLYAYGGTGKLTYLLNNKQSSNDGLFSSVIPGKHTLIIKDDSSCVLYDTIRVLEDKLIYTCDLLTAEPISSCGKDDGKIRLDVIGNTGHYSIGLQNEVKQKTTIYTDDMWNDGVDHIILGQNTGYYTLTIRDELGCIIDTFVRVNSPENVKNFKIEDIRYPSCQKLDGSLSVNLDETGFYQINVIRYVGKEMISNVSKGGITFGETYPFNNLGSGTIIIRVEATLSSCVHYDTVYLSDSNGPNADYLKVDPLCFGDRTGEIKLKKDPNNYYFIDNKPIEEDSLYDLKASIYHYAVRDKNDCSSFRDIEIIQPPKLESVNDSSADITCYGGANGYISHTLIGGTGNYIYNLIDKDNDTITNLLLHNSDIELRNLEADNYVSIIKDRNGCKIKLFDEIVEPFELYFTVDTIDNVPCSGDNNRGRIVTSPYGGNGSYKYSINGVNRGENVVLSGLSPAKYAVTLRDKKGCHYTDSVLIKRIEGLTLKDTTMNSLCDIPKGAARVFAKDGTPPFKYLWPKNQVKVDSDSWPIADVLLDTISNIHSGVYKVYIVDAKGCNDSIAVTIKDVNGPTITGIASSPISCVGKSDGRLLVNIRNGFAPYRAWIDTSKNFIAVNDTNDFVFKNLSTGRKSIMIKDGYGCLGNGSFTITSPDSIKANYLISKNPTCESSSDGHVQIVAEGGTAPFFYNLYQQPIHVTFNRNDLKIGSYDLSIRDQNNCSASTHFELSAPKDFTANLDTTINACPGQIVSLDAVNPGATYLWSSNNAMFTDTAKVIELPTIKSGIYYLKISKSTECFGVDTIIVNVNSNNLTTNFLTTNEAYAGDTIIMFDVSYPLPEAISWTIPTSFIELTNSTDQVKYYVAKDTGTFNVSMDAVLAGCSGTRLKSVTIYADSLRQSTKKSSKVDDILIISYPNPTNGHFTLNVDLNREKPITIEIFNNYGIKLKSTGSSGLMNYKMELDLTGTPKGLYYVKVTTGSQSATHKVTVQ